MPKSGCRPAIAGRQPDFGIAAQLHLMPGLDRGRGGGEDDREFLDEAAHHRHVAGVIMNPILLLEARLMRFIDDDEAQIGIGQEQRRSRPNNHRRLSGQSKPPEAPFLHRSHI